VGHPGSLTTAEWQTARRALTEREQQLRADLAEIPPPMFGLDIAGVRQAWPHMTLDEQREFMRLFLAKVTINRAKPGTKGFDPGRVTIEWKRL
jgi:site-specific DNA recombinase